VGRGFGFFFGGLLALLAVRKQLGRPALGRRVAGRSSGYTRRLATYATALLLLDAAFTAFAQLDVVLIGAFLNATAVGLFEAPLRVASFLHYPGLVAAESIGPRVARGGREEPNVAALESGLRLVILVQVAFSVLLAVWAQPIVELALGPKYSGSVETMRVLSAYAFLGGVGAVVASAANYLGEASKRVPIAVFTILINLGIDVLLIPRIGIIAGAIGTGVAFGFYVPAHLWIVHRQLTLDLRGLGRTLGRSLLAGAAFAGCLALFGTGSLTPLEWVGGVVLGVSAYLGLLLVTREVSTGELRAAFRNGRSMLRAATAR
jgi:O-antigen/teichoic acid export membrane protein